MRPWNEVNRSMATHPGCAVKMRLAIFPQASLRHECTTRDEAIDKIKAGCLIAIREGSAARNFDALESLIDDYPDDVMLCSDDKHPDELLLGHINQLAARAVGNGRDVMNVLRACSLNAVKHYGLDVGLLQVGDPADFALVNNLEEFRVQATYINGECVASDGKCFLSDVEPTTINRFNATPIKPSDLAVAAKTNQIRIMEAFDGQLIELRSTVGPAPTSSTDWRCRSGERCVETGCR